MARARVSSKTWGDIAFSGLEAVVTAFLILLLALARLRLLTQTLFATGVAGWASLLVTVASFGGNPSDPLGALPSVSASTRPSPGFAAPAEPVSNSGSSAGVSRLFDNPPNTRSRAGRLPGQFG